MIFLIRFLSVQFRNRYYSKWKIFKIEVQIVLAKIKRQFARPSLPNTEDCGINLHLGCGTINHPKFINIDGLPEKHIHYVRSIKNLAPFKDNSVDLIYASHCLEHFSYYQIPTVLNEWFRVLKKDGILRLAVPDFNCLVDIYQKTDCNIQAIQGMLMGGQDYKYNFHMAIFNYISLETQLKNVGFKLVRKWQPENNKLTNFNDCSKTKVAINRETYFVSLNIEAIK